MNPQPPERETSVLELVENIRREGDVTSSQEALYGLLRENVLPRLERKIPSRIRSRLDPESVLHEAFLRALGALDLFHASSENAFYAWVYRIARNYIADEAKRRSAQVLHLAAGDEEGPRASGVRAEQRTPESRVQRLDAIENLLMRMRPKDAEIIRLHRLEGLGFEEIAHRQGKTTDAVQRAYTRAWKKLRDLGRRHGSGSSSTTRSP